MAPTHFQRESESQRNTLATAEESVESQRGSNERLSTLVQWNTPLVRAWYLKEAFQLFWTYKQPWRAQQQLSKLIRSAMRSSWSHSRNSRRCCAAISTGSSRGPRSEFPTERSKE